ncbi:MAG: hypothetical protein WEB53_00465 [Akkermansiaceae bacterium]
MNQPAWKTCTENELWRYVAWHLEGEGKGEGSASAFQELERNLTNTA